MAARQLPPAPKGEFLWNNMRQFNQTPLDFLKESPQYGAVSGMKFAIFPVFVLNSPETIHQVLVEDASNQYKTNPTKVVLRPVLGNGLFINDGESWKRQRRLTQPAFHTRRISAYGDTMAQYADDLAENWRDGETLELDHEMTDLTMRIIAKTMFDADVSGDAREIAEAVTEVLHIVMARFGQLVPPLPMWVPTPQNRRFNAAIQRLNVVIEGFINERRASGEDKGDLLSMLIAAQDEDGTGGMTNQQIRDEAMTIFGAGHETTAVALTWTWYLLSQHPQIEAKLHAELDQVLGGRLPTLEDLPKLRYTEMIIKESMRLYPPAWATTREAIADIEIGGYAIRKGETTIVNIYGLHHDAAYFPNPEQFDPERFSPENEKSIPKYAYLPFGGGPRVCIGNAFAMMEAKLIVATIARRWQFRLSPDCLVQPQAQFTLRPKNGMGMMAQERGIKTAAPLVDAAERVLA